MAAADATHARGVVVWLAAPGAWIARSPSREKLLADALMAAAVAALGCRPVLACHGVFSRACESPHAGRHEGFLAALIRGG